MKPDILYRDARPTDANFVISSWLESYRSSDYAKHMPKSVYFDNYKHVVTKLLSNARVIIACNPEDWDQIFGYISFSDIVPHAPVLHYMYVKYPFRKMRIAEGMFKEMGRLTLPEGPIICTHANSLFDDKCKKYDLIYNPFLIEKVAA